jgi:hypothetical protein
MMELTITHQIHLLHNKRMQSDLLKCYALSSAADAKRYVATNQEQSAI